MAEEQAPRRPVGLRAAALASVRSVTGGRLVAEALLFASTIAVARLLGPADFGEAALGTFVFAVSAALATTGLASGLVRAEQVDDAAQGAAFAVSVAVGLALSVLALVVAPLVGHWVSDRAIDVLRVTAAVFLLHALGATSLALLQRELAFVRLAVVEITALAAGAVATIVAAALHPDPFALAYGFLAQAAAGSALALTLRPPPRLRGTRAGAREVLSFGGPTSLSSLLYILQRNAPLAVLSGSLRAADVGQFWRGSQLGVDYQGKVSGIVLRVMYPLLSRARDEAQRKRARQRMVEVHCALIFPLLTLLIVTGPVSIPWIFGTSWHGAVVPAQILAIGGFAAVVGTGTGPFILAAGRPQALVRYTGCALVALVVVLLAVSSQSLITICWTLAGFRVVNLMLTQYLLLQRIAGISLRQTLIRDVLPAGSACLALAGAYLGIDALIDGIGARPAMCLAVLVGAGSYGVVLRVVAPRTFADITALGRAAL